MNYVRSLVPNKSPSELKRSDEHIECCSLCAVPKNVRVHEQYIVGQCSERKMYIVVQNYNYKSGRKTNVKLLRSDGSPIISRSAEFLTHIARTITIIFLDALVSEWNSHGDARINVGLVDAGFHIRVPSQVEIHSRIEGLRAMEETLCLAETYVKNWIFLLGCDD